MVERVLSNIFHPSRIQRRFIFSFRFRPIHSISVDLSTVIRIRIALSWASIGLTAPLLKVFSVEKEFFPNYSRWLVFVSIAIVRKDWKITSFFFHLLIHWIYSLSDSSIKDIRPVIIKSNTLLHCRFNKLKAYTFWGEQTMCFASIALCLIVTIVPSIRSIPIICFINATLSLPPSSILYSNVTFESCRCSLLEEDVHGFQYDNESSSCYTIGNDSSLANLQITNHSRVCFLDPMGTVWGCQLNQCLETE